MLHSFKFQKIALATASLLAIGSYQASAQDATINITGQITASTCGLSLADTGSAAASGSNSKNILLGNVAPGSTTVANAGGVFGAEKRVVFSLTNGTQGAAAGSCFNSANTKWDISLGLLSNSVSTIGTTTFLKNSSTASGFTDAVVLLKSGVVSDPNTQATATLTNLALAENVGLGGNYLGGGFTASSGSSIVLSAQFANSKGSNAAATAGIFSQSIPVTIVYK
jgi:hypothetical protein